MDNDYLHYYNTEIAPKLMELDMFIKARELPIAVWQVSQLLDISYEEVKSIMEECKIKTLDYLTIFDIILLGSSELCRLLQREVKKGFTTYYSAKDISFIYEIDLKKVEAAFELLGATKIEGGDISKLFKLLPVAW